ncbi:MAG: zf-HC2 domain-containing protein [Acetobacteraceae bacterium]|nr:zf-HC2 domain-containing protein [Acetobacteraceae bacterium]
MKCRDVAELVTAYMEGALPPGTRFRTRMHLRLCASCRRYVDQLRRTVRLLADGPTPPPPEDEDRIVASMISSRREA